MYEVNEDALRNEVEAFKRGLPAGMQADEDHIAMLFAQPHRATAQASNHTHRVEQSCPQSRYIHNIWPPLPFVACRRLRGTHIKRTIRTQSIHQ